MAAKIDCDHLWVSGGAAVANRMKQRKITTIPMRRRYRATKTATSW
jgi:hypothetical protein